MSEPMNDMREEIELPPISHRYRGECTWDRCDPLEQRERELKAALLANREKDAEIARLKEQVASAEAACEEGSEIVGELSSLRASAGEKWIEVKEGCPVPEYGDTIQAICTSGNMESWQEIFEWIFTMGWEEMRACGVIHYKTPDWPLPAPPSTEKES